ncbi:MAG: hypothetical protein WDZ62_00185 [Candidatus Pacearchaeota archaeon]
MEIYNGLTEEEIVRERIKNSFPLEQNGIKKPLTEILQESEVDPNSKTAKIMKEQAELMAKRKYSFQELDGSLYVFSKDEDNHYFLRKSGIFENFMIILGNYFTGDFGVSGRMPDY